MVIFHNRGRCLINDKKENKYCCSERLPSTNLTMEKRQKNRFFWSGECDSHDGHKCRVKNNTTHVISCGQINGGVLGRKLGRIKCRKASGLDKVVRKSYPFTLLLLSFKFLFFVTFFNYGVKIELSSGLPKTFWSKVIN